ncbi:MAG TPA: TonB-dependent receptor, partial [Bacteroidales bacterium]
RFKEVVVEQEQNKPLRRESDISHYSTDPLKMINLPQMGENDLFRSLQLLPGVDATGETSAGLSIRGSMPEQNLVVFDGFNLYHVDHFFGEFSALNPEIIRNAQLFKGGYEAKYGGRATGMVLLTSRTGNLKKPTFSVGLNMLSSNAEAEIPLGKKVSLLLAGRRSYTDILKSNVYHSIFKSIRSNSDESIMNFGGVYENISNNSTPDFYYYDTNAKLSYFPNDKSIITFSFYKGSDNFSIANSHSGTIYSSTAVNRTNWGNTGGSVRWAKQWDARFYSNFSVGISEFSNIYRNQGNYYLINSQPYGIDTRETNTIDDITSNFHNELRLSNGNKLEFGLQATNHRITYHQSIDSTQQGTMENTGSENSFYLQDEYRPSSHVLVNPGMRVTYSNLAKETFIEPRLSATWFLSGQFSLKAAYSRNSQLINKSSFNDNEFYRDFWYNANDSNLRPLTSTHYILGGSFSNDVFDFDVECYYMKFNGLSTIKQSSDQSLMSLQKDFFTGTGTSRGVDVFLYKKTGWYNVWISYSFNKAENTFSALNNGKTFPADNDQRHEFKIANIFNYKQWTFSAVWIYGSGKPYTGDNNGFFLNLPDGTQRFFQPDPVPNALRLPSYHRMDVSCSYLMKSSWCNARIGVSIINLYDHRNTRSQYDNTLVTYDKNGQQTWVINRINTNSLGFTPNCFFTITF